MTTPTFNKFKSTTIYGNINNVDYPDNSVLASAYFQRNLTISGDLTCSGIIYGKKLYYNNVDISSTFVSNTSLTTTLNSYVSNSIISSYAPLIQPQFNGNIDINIISPMLNPYTFSIANATGTINMTTYSSGAYPVKINASNLQLSKNNGTNYYDVLTTNTGALLSGATFTGNVSGLTAITSDNTTKFATTAFVKAQNYLTTASLSTYALLSGATFTGNVSGLTAVSTDNTTKFATTAFVKAQNYLTTASLSLVTVNNTFTIKQPLATSSAVLQFSTDDGNSRANIYSSVGDSVFSFDIQSAYNTNGFRWQIGNTGVVLMSLDVNGNLTNNSATLKQLVFTSAGTTSTPYLTTNSGNNLVLSTATDNGLQFSTPSGGSSITSNGSTLKINGNLQVSTLLDSTTSSGTSGQVPTANGSGGWAWAANINTSSNSVFGTQQILN